MSLLSKINSFSPGSRILSLCNSFADSYLNKVKDVPPYVASTTATDLHKKLTVIDLHADTLMWERDLLRRTRHGHVDLPRLIDGNVCLQVFSVVTGIPFSPGLEGNKDEKDVIKLIARLQGWPTMTQTSRLQRALYQAEKLTNYIHSSDGKLKWITNRYELQALLDDRAQGKKTIGALLSLEGVHALEGKVDNIEKLFQAGFRMLGMAHFFDNAMAGSIHGANKHGLTEQGRQLVHRAAELGMIIDLSHASAQTIDDVISITDTPVVASHGGVYGTCKTARNLEDRHIQAIARTGGVIGIGVFKYATCGDTIDDTVRAMCYVSDLVGDEHIALGSDFDGSVTTLFDTSGWVKLTEALLNAGFSEQRIRAIMGENARRVFQQILPVE